MDYTVSLHTHLEGSVRPETFSELMGNDIKADLTVNKNCTSLKEFLDKIACGYPLTQRRQNLKRVAYEIVESASQNNCLYLEVRFGPTLHTSGDMQLEDTVEAVLEGFNEGERNFGVVTRAIISTLRHEDPAVSIRLAKLASKYKDLGVVGFDIAGDEANFKALPHKRSFEIAKEAGLGITAHAGEAGEPGNVKEAILELNASRIGHGIRVIEDKEVVEIAKERGIVFEVCPTSNIHTGAVASIKEHPIKQMVNMGLKVTVNDDDPQTSQITLQGEYEIANDLLDKATTRKNLLINSLEASFVSDTIKKVLLKKIHEM